MKIRNLQDYIYDRCRCEDSLKYLFTDDEPFFKTVAGGAQLRNRVSSCASLAKDAEQQVFYEFVQNAFDASADSVFFYMGKVDEQDYLLVLNNGKPFYTDSVEKLKKQKIEGQLFSFLCKENSDKPGEDAIGKHGVGSKLLYTLLTDSSNDTSLKDLMPIVLIEEKKAPYLLSWDNGIQLDNFLLDRHEWNRTCGFENREFLIAKIFGCYYPLEPGVDETLFSNKEVSKLVQVFQELVDPKRNVNRLQGSGTAIIIPLGKGKLDKILEPQRIGNVKKCLAPFVSIMGSYKKYKGKHLSRIVLLGDEIHSVKPDSVEVEIHKANNNNVYEYLFAFDKSFINEKCVNLYKALPISDTVYGLNFIVDSQDLPENESRQGISEADVAIHNITEAMKKFVERFDLLQVGDKDKYARIYDCLIKARPNSDIVKKPFDEVILPYLKEHVRRIDGTYGKWESTVVIKNRITVPFEQVGVAELYVASEDVVCDYFELGMPINELGLSKIIEQADEDKFVAWIKQLSYDDYEAYHKEAVKVVKDKHDKLLLRTNKGNVVSYDDVIAKDKSVYFIDIDPDIFRESNVVEFVELPLDAAKPSCSGRCIFDKLKEEQTSFVEREDVEFVCKLLSKLEDNYIGLNVRAHFSLLENCKGEKKTFEELFLSRPTDTVLFDKFVAKQPLPLSAKSSWFVQANEYWNWLTKNWNEIKRLEDWSEYHECYLADIQKIWNVTYNSPKEPLKLWLNKDGVPIEEEQFFIQGTSKSNLLEEDYVTLEHIFNDYTIVPYRFRNVLSQKPFSMNRVDLSDILSDDISRLTIEPDQLWLILDITTSFWDKYVVEFNDGNLQIRKMPVGGHNYWYAKNMSEAEVTNLAEAKFYRVPEMIACVDSAYSIDKNYLLLQKAIDAVPKKKLLFEIIKNNGQTDIVREFSKKVENLEFSTQEEIDEDNLDCRIIEWYAVKDDELKNNIWSKITLDKNHLPEEKLCPKEVKIGQKPYDAYELVPSLSQDDKLVKDLLASFPSSLKQTFEAKYCAKRRDTITPEEILIKLNVHALNVKQLEFALDYWKTEKKEIPNLSLEDDEKLGEALEMIGRRKIEHFYRKFNVDGLHPEHQIYAPGELLLDNEKLPQKVYDWISRNDDVLILFGNSHLYADHALLKVRRAFREGTLCDSVGKTKIAEDEYWILDNTFLWLLEQQEKNTIEFCDGAMNENVCLLQGLVKPGRISELYLLKYSTKVKDDKIIFKLCHPSEGNMKFLDARTYAGKLRQFIKEQKTELIDYLSRNDVFLPLKTDDLMRKHSLANITNVVLKYESQHDESWKEWTDPVYKEWLDIPESEGIRIFLSAQSINSMLRLMEDEECKVELPILEGELYGNSIDEKGKLKEVAVKFPNEIDAGELKALQNQAVPKISKFKDPFIALQGLMLDHMNGGDTTPLEPQHEEKLELVKDYNIDDLRMLLKGNTGTGNGTGNGMGDGFGNGNGFGNGGNPYRDEEKEEESKINMISGYLGELLYKGYLDKIGKKSTWDAEERNEGAYDFMVEKERYVEVKTNVRTIVDGESPLYLHKSQMQFLHAIDTDNYYICRISINDLGLSLEYSNLKNVYGTYNDPRKNAALKTACKKVADDFWQKYESVKLFEQTRRIYRIKDIFLEGNNF